MVFWFETYNQWCTGGNCARTLTVLHISNLDVSVGHMIAKFTNNTKISDTE